MDWKTIEILGMTYYTKKGYKILVQLVDNDSFDFVILKGGKYLSVNVKKAFKHKGRWCFSRSGGRGGTKIAPPAADIYLAWINPEGRFIAVTREQIPSVKTRLVRIPQSLL